MIAFSPVHMVALEQAKVSVEDISYGNSVSTGRGAHTEL